MPSPPVTIPVTFVHGMLSGVQARGLSCDAFLQDAGIAPELLGQAGARVTADQYVGLFRSLGERCNDDMLGFLSRPLKRGSLALVVRSTLGATTIEVAMRRAARTFGLLQDEVVLEPVRDGTLAGWALRFSDPGVVRPIFLHELLLRVFWRLLAWLAGGKLPPARFDFAFAIPSCAGSYGKIFPAPLQFGRQQSALWFDAGLLQSPMRRDEAAVRAFLADAQVHMVVPPRDNDVVSERVRIHLQQARPAWPDLAATAEALHMSASTLQRRLALEGLSFQALKDELRRDLAIVRLGTSAVPLAVLAAELGFADNAAFQRAFKHWTGSSPGAYRRGVVGAGTDER